MVEPMDSWEDIDTDNLPQQNKASNNEPAADSWEDIDTDNIKGNSTSSSNAKKPAPNNKPSSFEEELVVVDTTCTDEILIQHGATLLRKERVEEERRRLGLLLEENLASMLEREHKAHDKAMVTRMRILKLKGFKDRAAQEEMDTVWKLKLEQARDQKIGQERNKLRTASSARNDKLVASLQDMHKKLEASGPIVASRRDEMQRLLAACRTVLGTSRLVPAARRDNGVADVALPLAGDDVIKGTWSHPSLQAGKHLHAPIEADQIDIKDLPQDMLPLIRSTIALITQQKSSHWIESVFEETYNVHSGRSLDGFTDFQGKKDQQDQQQQQGFKRMKKAEVGSDFFWQYGQALKHSQRPPELNEFSQTLRVQVEIQADRFPDPKKGGEDGGGDDKKKKGGKADKEKGKGKGPKAGGPKGKGPKKGAKPAAAAPVIVDKAAKFQAVTTKLDANVELLKGRPTKFLSDARKLVLELLTHPDAPDNESRNKAAVTVLGYILEWLLGTYPKANQTPAQQLELFTTVRDMELNFSALFTPAHTKMIDQARALLPGDCGVLFQMRTCGPFLIKNAEPRFFPHPDVPFVPDAWQCELLDCIDRDVSCLVVAPTSAGKSFVSFYTISRALARMKADAEPEASSSSSSSGGGKAKHASKAKPSAAAAAAAAAASSASGAVASTKFNPASGSIRARVVFVAPTLPLCNQMAATVLDRYNYAVDVGVFTSEFERNLDTCSVLICTPDMLEVLLMSPSCEEWRRNLLYVILDEIHYVQRHFKTARPEASVDTPSSSSSNSEPAINEDDDEQGYVTDKGVSEAYSRIFALLECPFLALSATVDRPHETVQWLQSIRNGKTGTASSSTPASSSSSSNKSDNSQIQLVPSNYADLRRWVDLQMHLYVPQASGAPNDKTTFAKPADRLHPVHPLTIARFAPPSADLSVVNMSPFDLLTLYEVMHAVIPATVANLNPEKFAAFTSKRYIDRVSCSQYRQELMKAFLGLAAEQRELVLSRLSQDVPLEAFSSQAEEKDVETSLVDFAAQLREHDMLPALCFCEDTALLTKALTSLVDQLENLEAQFGKRPEPPPKAKKEDDKDAKADEDEDEGRVDHRKMKADVRKRSVETRLDLIEQEVWPVDPNYSLRNKEGSLSLVKYWLVRMLRKLDLPARHIWIRGLARGIAIYHTGLSKPYRDLVETMFRQGLIQMVMSTRALSVGVNMPCKSVVFLVDSQFIDPVEYRQMSGRAGRRGFDVTGCTVFCKMPLSKIARLTLSPNAPLIGASALTIDSVLRALTLYHMAHDKAAVRRCVERWFVLPTTRAVSKAQSDVTEYCDPTIALRFSIELLFRMRAIDASARPIGLSGIIAHNFEVFPANYSFTYLVMAKAFEADVKPYLPGSGATEKDRVAACRKIVSVLAYMIGRVYVQQQQPQLAAATPAAAATDADQQTAAEPAKTLETPPAHVMDLLKHFNDVVNSCVDDVNVVEKQTPASLTALKDLAPRLALVPGSKLNSYALDFFDHKSIVDVIRYNHMLDNVAYNLLKKFTSVVRKLSLSVQKLTKDPSLDPFARAMNDMANRYHHAFTSVAYSL
eukprot:TRINITY_DN811_c0_g1_i3.p1 TRINITY_DN811_c0_g1~~TRINITY_DN811_c0_g1_i3.p1  ORF type:complete len:1573 (-),score=491.09 TRINITY_DN811_c0_g1_i3:31-4749(-)